MTNIIGNLSVHDFYDPETHGSKAPISYSIHKANYFRYNIKFTLRLLGRWRDAREKLFFFMTGRICVDEGKPEKSLCDWTKKISSQRKEEKMLKHKKGTKMFLCLLWEKVENVCQAHGFFVALSQLGASYCKSSQFGDFLTKLGKTQREIHVQREWKPRRCRSKSFVYSWLFNANLQFDKDNRNNVFNEFAFARNYEGSTKVDNLKSLSHLLFRI